MAAALKLTTNTIRALSAACFSMLLVGQAAAFNLDSLLIQSVGGPAAVDRLRNMTTSYAAGTAILNGLPGSYEVYVAIPDNLCMEMKLGPFALAQAFDGATAWQRDHNGQVSELSGYEKRALLSQVYFQTYSFLLENRLPGEREYLGIETRGGRPMHRVGFYPLYTDTVYSYFDTTTGYQSFDVITVDNLEIVTEYSDHAIRGGVLMPLTSRSSVPAAQTEMRITVDSVAFNLPVDPRRFVRRTSTVDFRFPAGHDSVVVPFELIAGHIYFHAQVNGRLLRFILDSGASANMFHRPALDGLDLPVVGNLPAIGVAGYEHVDLVRTDSINIGGLVLLGQVGGALDLSVVTGGSKAEPPFGGILGYDFLSRFPVLIDYQAGTLTFFNADNFQPPDGGHEVPFELTLQIPTIEAELLGLPGRYIVDLGNAFGLIVHSDFSRKHDLVSRLGDVSDLPHEIGGLGGGLSGKTAYAASFSFGDVRITDLRIMLPDSGSGLAGSVELAGNIGNLLLKQFRVLFDYGHQQLVFYDIAGSGE
ncbi:MAG: retropepsin-like aspartic protease [Candidatus Zixiibacteriota bacterium]